MGVNEFMDTVEMLLNQLDETREQLLIQISELSDEELTQTGAVGNYSVADILVNLTVWEAELVTALMKIDQGKKPTALLAALQNRKQFNEKRYQENKNRSLDLIFNDLQQVRVQLESWLEAFSEKGLTSKKRYKWLKGKSLVDIIAEVTYKNEARYLPMLAIYANKVLENN